MKEYRSATSIDIIKVLARHSYMDVPHMPEVYFVFDSNNFLCSFYPFLFVCCQHQVNERIETKSLWYSRNRECAFDYVNEFVDKHIRVHILFVAGKLSFVMWAEPNSKYWLTARNVNSSWWRLFLSVPLKCAFYGHN